MSQRGFLLGIPCPACGTYNAEERTTCAACGAALAPGPVQPIAPPPHLTAAPGPLDHTGCAILYMVYLLASVVFGMAALYTIIALPEDWETDALTLSNTSIACITTMLIALSLITLLGVALRTNWARGYGLLLHILGAGVFLALWRLSVPSGAELANVRLSGMLFGVVNILCAYGFWKASAYFNR
jgi:hypothetical protein